MTCYRHGHAPRGGISPEYQVWAQLIGRCTNPKHSKYPSYGGRGITVCDQWRSSFAAFLADMGLRPSPQHSIEREDNDGPYSRANCRWATKDEQNRNKRSNRYFEINGQRLCLADVARLAKLPLNTFRMRLEHGWPLEKAFSTPKRPNQRTATSADARS
ncbi:hypothetical protein MKK84_21180 [Methylobacterium sp. E-065]|uniref:hypothetical protein n=1 Tax=Methylobacterium sp. E-065 TaxID=2836583 RepID=UPI001FBAAD5F|nr:hypothetical protein [Methylobacterium sp. E-065]MCJ2019916.1 hypothetical protein [Methylobacterium sp. E-065]